MAKIPRFCHFEGIKNGTLDARIKISKESSNQKMQENKLALKFNFT